jgi:tetratricopeptide (TPR) repeat protein
MFARQRLLAALSVAAAMVPATAAADPDGSSGAIEPVISAVGGDRTATAVTGTVVTMTVAEPGYDGLQRLIDEEAREAMNKGDFRRAWYLFRRLLEIDPDDVKALRESARVGQALGSFEYSVTAFARVEEMTGGKPDPELHYLRGEALDALGKRAEAEREWAECERELSVAPLDQQGTLWMARIAALRKNLPRSLELYETVLPAERASSGYADIRILEVEAYILSKKWKDAERELRALLEIQREHPRAQALLAWVLEARGTHVEAADLRAAFAGEWTDHPRKTVEYARALERIYDLRGALGHYREARALGIPDLDRDIERVHGRIAPEVGGGVQMRDDGSGLVTGWQAGANLPLTTRSRIAVTALQESSSNAPLPTLGEDRVASGSLWGMLSDRKGDRFAVGLTGRQSERFGAGVGGSFALLSSQDRSVQFQLRADYGQAWRESATTVREGGVVDAASAVIYKNTLHGKLLFSGGVQGRRLALTPRPGEMGVHAAQMLGIVGADYTLFAAPEHAMRGEILGDDMLAPRSLASAVVLSYRHYELAGENPFGERLSLVTRSSLDELSATASHVIDDRGRLAAEVRGGIGHDWARDGQRYRAGASLMLGLTHWSRFTFDYDLASETTTGLVGRRHAGQAVLHVDL